MNTRVQKDDAARWLRRARDDWKQAHALMRKARDMRDRLTPGLHFGTIVSLALGFRKSALKCQDEARQCQLSANQCQK